MRRNYVNMHLQFPSMRLLIFVTALFNCVAGYGQAQVKTMPGVFIYDLADFDSENNNSFKVSPSGNMAATKAPSHEFTIIDFSKGSVVKVNRNMPHISSDLRYLFKNDLTRVMDSSGTHWARQIKWAGTLTDTMVRSITVPYYVWGMDEQNNFIASKSWGEAPRGHSAGMHGIYRLDRHTGKELQALRTDTFFTCRDYDGCPLPYIRIEKNYLLIAEKRYSYPIRILPFGTTNTITINDNSHHSIGTDSSFVYTFGTVQGSVGIKAFHAFTGKLLATKVYPPANSIHKFVLMHNKIYSFNPVEGMIQEASVANDSIIVTRSWSVNILSLAKAQNWGFTVIRGPSLFIYPLSMNTGEAGGMEANAASVFNTASNKISFHMYPFYNRSSGDVAAQQKAMKDQQDFVNRQAKEKVDNDPCKTGWNNAEYIKGLTRKWNGMYVILRSFDCKEDVYTVWQPAQRNTIALRDDPDFSYTVQGSEFRQLSQKADKHYHTCTDCDGDGTTEVTIYTTKTKELPWGYFSGIETKKITTTAKTSTTTCKTCQGRGVILK